MIDAILPLLLIGADDSLASAARAVISDRYARIATVRVAVEQEVYQFPLSAPPLYREAWRSLYPEPFRDELWIVRPNVLDHFLTDYEAYKPFDCSVIDGQYVPHSVTSKGDVWSVNGKDVQVGRYAMHPLLFAYDIHIQDSVVPQLSLPRLMADGTLTVTRWGEDGYRLAGSTAMRTDSAAAAYTQLYEADISAAGVPMRFRVENRYPVEMASASSVWELYTLETTLVNGTEFPIDIVITVSNPNVDPQFGTLHEFRTTDVEHDPSLNKASITLVPDLRNAWYFDGATFIGRYYGATGEIQREWRDGIAAPADDPVIATEFSIEAQTMRTAAIPAPLVLCAGVGTLAALRFRRG